MAKYKCKACEFIYDEDEGLPDNGIDAGTNFEDLAEDWVCPLCDVAKDFFDKVED